MTDAQATAQAFTDIAAALQLLQAAAAGARGPAAQNPQVAAHTPLLDLFDEATPFDMSSRAGSTAMTIASAALGEKWDGTVTKLPTFLLSLKQRAQDVKWNGAAPHGILTFADNTGTDRNLLDYYHSISAKRAPPNKAPTDPSDIGTAQKPKLPPFVRHFKASAADDSTKFKVGDTKVFEGATWYFCDARHRTNIRWHKFPASECRQRSRGPDNTSPPIAALGDASDAPTVTPTQVSGLTHATDIAAMLANCYALAADNSIAQDSIATALEAIRDA